MKGSFCAVSVALLLLTDVAVMAQVGSGKKSVNSLMIIVPYKHEGLWVFDDESVGLKREPFIAGMDTLIDRATATIPDAEHGFRALFSATPFPGATLKLDWRRAGDGGNWYYNPEFQQEGWLCPALYKYFPEAPREIYVKVAPRISVKK